MLIPLLVIIVIIIIVYNLPVISKHLGIEHMAPLNDKYKNKPPVDNYNDKIRFHRPTRCFSCEKEAMRTWGKKSAYKGQPTKCFSCEANAKQRGTPPGLTGPSKCFGCLN